MHAEWPEERRRLLNTYLNDLAVLEADIFRERMMIQDKYLRKKITAKERDQALDELFRLRQSISLAMRDFIGIRAEEVPEDAV